MALCRLSQFDEKSGWQKWLTRVALTAKRDFLAHDARLAYAAFDKRHQQIGQEVVGMAYSTVL